MTNVNQTAAAPIVAMTPEDVTKITGFVGDWIKLDADRELALHNFLRVVGDAPTYDRWMLAREAGIKAYTTKNPKANEDAQNKFWSRYVAQLRQYANEKGFDCTIPEKPKAATPEAQRKQAERSNAYADKPKADIETAVAKLAETLKAAPTPEAATEYSKATAALAKVQKTEAAEAAKTAKAATAKRRETVRNYVKDCPDAVLHMFELLLDATHQAVAPDVQRKAAAQLATIIIGGKPSKAKPASK